MKAEHLPLGKPVTHPSSYDPSQLCPISRSEGRGKLGLSQTQLPFFGEDIWTAYELSWLNNKGKPEIAVGEISFCCASPNLIESKSLKLYVNSFNQTRFESAEKVRQTMEQDLAQAAGKPVKVRLIEPGGFEELQTSPPEGDCIDGLDIDISRYQVDPGLLQVEQLQSELQLHSNLLRTNCPVTGQPDWATVIISYSGNRIVEASLLAYLISFRQHTGFHENCVETIFTDIMTRCHPSRLTVYARFTRRGGIDINPYRSSHPIRPVSRRLARQ